MEKALIVLHLIGKKTPNGNPVKCFVFYDIEGALFDAVDEGYSGRSRIKDYIKEGYKIIELDNIKTTNGEIKGFIELCQGIRQERNKKYNLKKYENITNPNKST